MPTSSNETEPKPGCSCIQPCVDSTHLWICSFTVSDLWYISGKNHCQASFQGHIRLYQFLHRNFGCTKGIGAVAQLEQFRDVIASLLRNHTQTANNHMFFCMHLSALIAMHWAHVPHGNMMGIPRHPKSTRAIIQIMTESARNRKRMQHLFVMQTSLSYFHFCIFIFLLVMLVLSYYILLILVIEEWLISVS